MTEHDPFCIYNGPRGTGDCRCEFAALVRADERTRIAAAIAERLASAKQVLDEAGFDSYWEGSLDAYDAAEQIARGEL